MYKAYLHVDKTLGENETVSSDILGGNVTKKKLRKFRFFRRKAKDIITLRNKVIELQKEDEGR